MSGKLFYACASLFLAFADRPMARAQMMDYSKYESLFGETVTNSATGKPERLSDTPVVMEVITADDIARSGARDIPTLLGRLAGIETTHSSTSSINLGIGGYVDTTFSRVMVLINGRQVYFDGYNDIFWSSLPVELEEIRQIEVIRGAESALYGFNAVDGVINIITFSPAEDRTDFARARVGSLSARDFAASFTQALGQDGGVRITAADDRAHDDGLIEITPGQDQYEKKPSRRSLSLDLDYGLGGEDRLGIEASHTDVSERSVLNLYFYDARLLTDSVKASLSLDSRIGHIDATSYLTLVDVPWAQTGTFQTFSIGDHSAVAKLSDLFKLDPTDSFRIGFEGRHDSAVAGATTDGKITGNYGAASAMWDHRFSPDLSMVNALRYDFMSLGRTGPNSAYDIFTNRDFDHNFHGLSGNAALVDRLNSEDSLRLAMARGLLLPAFDELGEIQRAMPPNRGYIFGNPDLLPSVIYDEQLSFEHRFSPWDITAGVTLFHEATMRHVDSTFLIVNGAPAAIFSMAPGSVANGVQASLGHRATQGWSWGANYSFERLNMHGDLHLNEALPVDKFNLHIGYGWGQWEADLYASAAIGIIARLVNQRFPYPVIDEPLKSYSTLGPRLAWRPVEALVIEASSPNLWAYKDSTAQRIGATYMLSVTARY